MLELSGSIVAVVTPFKDGKVDEAALKSLVEFHVKEGSSGIVPCGTTGESATLSHEEHERVIEVVIQAARGRIKVIAGTGSNSTAEAVRLTAWAKKAGADAALLVAPYYNKPTQEGVYRHYQAISEACDLPLVPYSIQGRTGINIEPETVARLAGLKNVVAIKEASGNLEQMSRIHLLTGGRLTILSGDDALTLPVLAIGGKGVISVIANIAPKDTAAMVRDFLAGNLEAARKVHYKQLPLIKTLFLETNPIPVKTAAGLMGLCGADMRLPLCEMSAGNLEKLKAEMKNYGLLH
jgi:4-hydroxy-tetrahydrodipicolinate synthase